MITTSKISDSVYGATAFAKAVGRFKDNLFEYDHSIISAHHSSPLSVEKAMAVANLYSNHSFWEDWNTFNHSVSVLNDRPADFYHLSIPTPAEVVWALVQVRMIDPVGKLSNEVGAFVGAIFSMDGFVKLPPELAKEITIEDLPLQYFLTKSNQHNTHHPESEAMEQVKFKLISDYISLHNEALTKELTDLRTELI
jgi:hypothetical protein